MYERPMTVKELSDYLHIAYSTVYRMVERRQLPAFKIGSHWRFDIEAIDRWRFSAPGKIKSRRGN